MAFDQNKYIQEFQRENYDRISVRVPKGKKKVLKELAEKTGKSVNQMFVEAFEEYFQVDLTSRF